MPKQRIALFLPSLVSGGAERVMLNIARGFTEYDNIEVDLVLCKAEGPYLTQVPANIRVVDLNSPRIALSVIPLIRYLIREKPVAVLSALDTANLILIWAAKLCRSSARIVVSVHCNFSSALKGQKSRRAKLLPGLVRIFYRFTHKVIAVSQGVADDLIETTGTNKQGVVVQVNPVITPELDEKLQQPSNHPWLGQSAPVILAIGRLTYQKNFELLINAFARLRKTTDARLIILGEGEEKEKLLQLATNHGVQEDIDFHGFIDNPYPLMRDSTLFVLSSHFEGLPTVLIEALHCGATIVSTDCPSGPSEILENGRLGKLVEVNNVEALSKAMSDTLKETQNTNTEDALQKYYLHNVVESYRRHLLD